MKNQNNVQKNHKQQDNGLSLGTLVYKVVNTLKTDGVIPSIVILNAVKIANSKVVSVQDIDTLHISKIKQSYNSTAQEYISKVMQEYRNTPEVDKYNYMKKQLEQVWVDKVKVIDRQEKPKSFTSKKPKM